MAKIRFRDFSRYYFTPPRLCDLAGKTRDERGAGRREVLFIVPSYHDAARLGRLLGRLSRQSFRNFDVLVVYGKDDAFLRSAGLRMLHVRRKIDAGFAGAVYLGQLVALKEGYRYYIATDVDKLPSGDDALLELYREAEGKKAEYVRGRCAFEGASYPDGGMQKTGIPATPRWHWPFIWGLVRTDTIEKAGLYPLPLYLGCDDIEYHYRLRKCKVREAVVGGVTFMTYFPLMRLFNLVRQGGFDRTYRYPIAFSARNMPETYLEQFRTAGGGVAENARALLLTLMLNFLAPGIMERMLEARMPQFAGYRKKACQAAFVAPFVRAGGDAVIKAAEDAGAGLKTPAIDTGVTFGVLKQFAAAIFDWNPAGEKDQLLALSNRTKLSDLPAGKAYLFRWRRKVGAPYKIAICLLSCADAAGYMGRACLNVVGGRHLFDRYGLKEVAKFLGKARQATGKPL